MQKIDIKCLQGFKQVKKEDKDSEKNKSANIPFTNIFSRK